MENSGATHHSGVYSNTQIKSAIESGHIICHPYHDSHLNGSSLDLTLGEYFYRTSKNHSGFIYNPYDPSAVTSYFGSYEKAVTHSEWCAEHGIKLLRNIAPDQQIIILEPGERILAHTNEFVGIKPPGTSSIQARSTWGRNGVSVCFDAGWGDPGYINRWTLEIYNLNKHQRVVLPVGERIAQIIFIHTGRVDGEYIGLSGKYQSTSDLTSLIDTWSPEQMLPKSYKDSPLKEPDYRNQGKYIVLEGSDGTGKTTQASLLYYRLAKAGVPMCGFMLAEPGEIYRLDSSEDALAFPNWRPDVYEKQCLYPAARAISRLIKDKEHTYDPQTRVMLHSAAHRAAWVTATRNALSQGLTVIATRNWLSAVAYQGYGDGVDTNAIETVTRELVGEEYLHPNATLVMTHDNENERLARIYSRGEEISVHEEKDSEFQRRVSAGYKAAAEEYDLNLIDANDSVEAIHERIWQLVSPLFDMSTQKFIPHKVPEKPSTLKIAKFKNEGASKLHFVLDFDRTLVAGDSPGTFDILRNYLPTAGQKQYDMLFQHYRPRDANGSLTADEAALWTASILDLLAYYQVNVAALELDIPRKMTIRPFVAEFFALCAKLSIPTVIVSAGVQKVIDEWCREYSISPTLVLANKVLTDTSGRIIGWDKKNLLHPLNKHKASHIDFTAIISSMPYAILVGDNVNDWNMAKGNDSVLRIFIHDSPLETVTEQTALRRFDMVLGTNAFKKIVQIITEIYDGE